MKLFKSIFALFFVAIILNSLSSCIVLHPHRNSGNNGKHKGWYKNSNNPHNPNTTNPGHSGKGKGRKK